MPPSPTMRFSPRRELRVENHKRGCSLESGILLREKDDDLALFNDVQCRERDNFLLQSNDDFEDTFSTKLRYFSDNKLGISIAVRGESNDLLNADGEKNDYDWLLTPPDTPLFPSLDAETPPVNLPHRGRPRSQPISISRSSTMEKSRRSSRGSASPNRLSASPRSSNSMLQSRGSPSSEPHYSPTPSLQHATSLQRPSPQSSKPLTPALRSSALTPQRVSTGSIGAVASSGVRGASPVRTSRGNSASPKIKAWQSNIPGFSSEVPPNLRTTLADRPASYVRGTSPASRNGRDSSSKSGRQSMSPTASRSISSSYGHDRDRFSSYSKGSVASSGDDDVDSLQSIHVGSLDRSASKIVSAFSNNRALEKPTRTAPSSSAPKRSFDLALRQMDHRKGPQNMFRPLLSSVPSSTFYVGKASAAHHAFISRNSSVTTSSNASSDQGTNGAHDTKGSDLNQEDVTSECVKAPYPDVQDEMFVFDKADALNEDTEHGSHERSPSSLHNDFNGGSIVDSPLDGSENLSGHDTATSEALGVKGDFSDVDSLKNLILCSKCARRYCATESIEGDLKLCPDCHRSHIPLTITTAVTPILVAENSSRVSTKSFEGYHSLDALEPLMAVHEYPEVTSMGGAKTDQHKEIVKEGQTSYSDPIWNFLSGDSLVRPLEDGEPRHANQLVIGQQHVRYSIPDGGTKGQQMQPFSDHPNVMVDVPEGAGISVLLKSSSSGKGPVVQSRVFTASSIPYDVPSYVRDSANSMRGSIGHGSVSASSSVDLGSMKQTETHVQQQLGGRKSDLENYRYDMNTKHQRTGSSLSGTSNHAFQLLELATSLHEESFGVSATHVEKDDANVKWLATQELLLASVNKEVDGTCTDVESNYKCITIDASTSELSSHIRNVHLVDNSVISFSNFEESASCENGEDLTNNKRSICDAEASATTQGSCTLEEDAVPNSCVDRVNVAEVPTQSSLDMISEIEIENTHHGSPGSQSNVVSPNSKSSIDELQEPSVPTAFDKDITASAAESDTSDHAHDILEELTVGIGTQRGSKARSLTLEEATDTIFFCSSIIQNLAYDAAAIAMEKENYVPFEPFECSRPTVILLGKENCDRRDPQGRTASKRTSKSQKTRQRWVEIDTKPLSNTNGDEKTDVSTTRIIGIPNNDDSMKPPKLESKCNCTIM